MLKMKQKIGLNIEKTVDLKHIHNTVGIKENKKIAQRVASEAITCVKLEKDLLPISKFPEESIYVVDMYDHEYDHSISHITKGLLKSGLDIRPYQVDESDSEKIINQILDAIPNDAMVVINTFLLHIKHGRIEYLFQIIKYTSFKKFKKKQEKLS